MIPFVRHMMYFMSNIPIIGIYIPIMNLAKCRKGWMRLPIYRYTTLLQHINLGLRAYDINKCNINSSSCIQKE